MIRAKHIVAASLVVGHGFAPAFELTLSDPEFTLAVPGVPAIDLHEESSQPVAVKRSLTGSASNLSVDIELLPQSSEVSPRVCAGLLLRSLVAQPGMPARDNIYRAPLNANTFLVIYVIGKGQQQKLHAHVFSSAGKSHCANAHFTRPATPGEDIDNWRITFMSARVGAPAR